MRQRRLSISLQFAVPATITLCLFVVAAALLFQAHRGMRHSILTATGVSVEYMADALRQSFYATVQPSNTSLRVLRYAAVTRAKTHEERMESVPALAELLLSNPISNAVYIGYTSGELFALRQLVNSKEHYPGEPAGAAYIVRSLTHGESGGIEERSLYLDAAYQVLEGTAPIRGAFDPLTRPWFIAAMQAGGAVITTPPYVFFYTGEIGVTLAERSGNGEAVVALDITTRDLTAQLENLQVTPGTHMVLVDEAGHLVAQAHTSTKVPLVEGGFKLRKLNTADLPMLSYLLAPEILPNTLVPYAIGGEEWYGFVTPLTQTVDNDLLLLVAIPAHELFAKLWQTLWEHMLWTSVAVVLCLLISWKFGHDIVKPLQLLTGQLSSLRRFDFTPTIGVSTVLREVQEMGRMLRAMARAIRGFLAIAETLNKEQGLERMLDTVLQELLSIVRGRGGAIYLYNSGLNALDLATSEGGEFQAQLLLPPVMFNDAELARHLQEELHGTCNVTLLRSRENELVGALCVIRTPSQHEEESQAFATFMQQISSSAAVAVETRKLMNAQTAMLEGVIRLVADAIDAKSQHTGGHCRRVPRLAQTLLDVVKQTPNTPFAPFTMSRAQDAEFQVGAWLHDCGKITTPEYVVDKATKLEMIRNRIHEIRMRFEVLHRDAEIQRLEAMVAGMPEEEATAACRALQETLQEEFAFVAQCNIGGEFMRPEDEERLRVLARREWLRFFNDRLGLGHEESERARQDGRPGSLPVKERLLADKPSHLVRWREGLEPPVQAGDPRNIWGFDMELPEYMYNYGEIYTLSVKRGTLTAEERFKINEHMVQTISLLSSLPLPQDMQHVPDIAGSHHETMDGKGYPRKLTGKSMSVPERVMAIADVFEALTASDRPYKKAKTLHETFSIMRRMVQNNHLDRDLFNLFLESGVFLEYASNNLTRAQQDVVDVAPFLVPPSEGMGEEVARE